MAFDPTSVRPDVDRARVMAAVAVVTVLGVVGETVEEEMYVRHSRGSLVRPRPSP